MTPEEFERMIDSGLRNPYLTFADPGYFVCGTCGEDIQPGDLIQRPKWKPKGDRTAWHYDCEDPKFQAGFDVARLDAERERARGHKSEVNRYWSSRANKDRRR
jgi:hypothetical protein